jgi:hypothetical protein
LKGVTKAVNDPLKFVLAVMDFLRTRASRLCRLLETAIHIGSGGAAKGPRRSDLCPAQIPVSTRFFDANRAPFAQNRSGRDFAAVLAQT